MHTFKMGNHRIHHDGDYGGDVILMEVAGDKEHAIVSEMKVPARLLYLFTAEMIRAAKVESIERESSSELLGLPKGTLAKK